MVTADGHETKRRDTHTIQWVVGVLLAVALAVWGLRTQNWWGLAGFVAVTARTLWLLTEDR